MSIIKSYPTLYKKTSTGAIETWQTHVEEAFPGATIVTQHGQLGGKLIESRDTITEGKNIGKKNETTATEQACREAASRWKKKIERHGYVQSAERAGAGETDQAGGIAPMLAIPHEGNEAKLTYPALLQRKYNGVRCIAVYENGATTLWSRKREQMHCVPHIAEAVTRLFAAGGVSRAVLDGEIYRHGWSLQTIASYARQKTKPKAGHEELQYHVYDYPSHDGTNWDRARALEGLEVANDFAKPLVFVPTVIVPDEARIWEYHDAWVRDGYEGAIGRNHHGLYEAGKRSKNLHKFKRFDETEFEVVDYRLGRGKYANIPVLLCKTAAGVEFECCPPGTLAERAAVNRDEIAGKMLTVKHLGWTDDKKPSCPVGVVIRDYE